MTTKRKRGGLIQTPLGELVVDISPRKKKARFAEGVEELALSDVDAASDVQSYSESNTATATVTTTFNDTATPLTDASSTRSKSNARPYKYICTYEGCGKAYNRPIHLQTHMNTHTGVRPHACPEEGCNKSFTKREHLNRHMQDKHSNDIFICEYPVRNEDTGIETPCGREFPSTFKLKRHAVIHKKKEETTCTWDGCGKVFRKQDTLQRHIKKDHLHEDAWVCTLELPDGEMCGRAFAMPGQLLTHKKEVHDAPRYWCEICTNTADPPSPHIRFGNDLDPEFLPTADDLRTDDGSALDPTIMDQLSLDEFVPVNLVTFTTYHELQRHNTLIHPPTCNECGKICKTKKDLAAHFDIHHSGDPDAAEAHKPQKRFVCPYEGCPRAELSNGFTHKGNMQQHAKSAHEKERKFICGETDLAGVGRVEGWDGQGCSQALVTKSALIGHIRTQHMGLPVSDSKLSGLRHEDRKRPVKKTKSVRKYIKQETRDDDDDYEDEDMVMGKDYPGDPTPSTAMALLTGHGYEELRLYSCLLAASDGCQMRFTKEHELGVHMEFTHEWNIDDINDALGNPDTFAS